jgi:hypothetical protein
MRLWSQVRSRWKGARVQRPFATPVGGLGARNAEIVDFTADGGAMSWGSPAGDAFQPIDPYLLELGWRAWFCMVEENVLGRMGFSGLAGGVRNRASE